MNYKTLDEIKTEAGFVFNEDIDSGINKLDRYVNNVAKAYGQELLRKAADQLFISICSEHTLEEKIQSILNTEL